MSNTSSKIALLIDGLNIRASARTFGFETDCKRLLPEFESRAVYHYSFLHRHPTGNERRRVESTGGPLSGSRQLGGAFSSETKF